MISTDTLQVDRWRITRTTVHAEQQLADGTSQTCITSVEWTLDWFDDRRELTQGRYDLPELTQGVLSGVAFVQPGRSEPDVVRMMCRNVAWISPEPRPAWIPAGERIGQGVEVWSSSVNDGQPFRLNG